MKYIDAETLKYEIERRNLSNYHTTTEGYEEELYEIIDSLQQEQPQVADASKMEETGLNEAAHNFALLYDNGTCDGIAQDCFKAGAKWGAEQAEKDTIDRACKWLFSHLPILLDYYNEDIHEKADRSEFIKLFRTQMEEEQ